MAALAALLVLGSAAWGVLALWYLHPALGAAFGIASLAVLAAILFTRFRLQAFSVYLLLFALVLWRWQAIEPSNDRDWQPETARLAWAEVAGEQVTVHDIRNFDYRSENDFTPAYYDKAFDLGKLDSVDMVASYWMGPAIAHVFLTFNFGADHLAVSIEARKERGEGYSTLGGFFRQYEIYYVVADERDVIRLRTNYRRDPPEQVYLFRIKASPENARRLFLEYVAELNRLKERPEFYNTLTTNCTSTIWMNARVNDGRLPYSWKLLVSGHVPELLYEKGKLDTGLPFAELQKSSLINARAAAADHAADFSTLIRK